MLKYKDDVLVTLAKKCNIAQFVSYGPDGERRHCCICGNEADLMKSASRGETIQLLLDKSIDHSINIRTFLPEQWSGNPFIVCLTDINVICNHIDELTSKGYYVIVHESIDVHDGGISCVLENGVVEFVPGDTPRFVEKVSELPIPRLMVDDFITFLRPIYKGISTFERLCKEGYLSTAEDDDSLFDYCKDRVEFSLHPRSCGYKNDKIIIWEIARDSQSAYDALTSYNVFSNRHSCYDWPNAFSQHIGDKAYGLLVANMFTKHVPQTAVCLRSQKVESFVFGTYISIADVWTRTCPNVQVPGKYATIHGYVNPYELMDKEDPDNEALVSCIIQNGIPAKYSGAYICDGYGKTAIEGVRSYGDSYMQGAEKEQLPDDVKWAVEVMGRKLYCHLHSHVRFEWVYDGVDVWIVQLHMGTVESDIEHRVIYKDEVSRYVDYHPADGLDKLRELIKTIDAEAAASTWHMKKGVRVVGNVGMSSHIADVLRKAHIGSYIFIPEK